LRTCRYWQRSHADEKCNKLPALHSIPGFCALGSYALAAGDPLYPNRHRFEPQPCALTQCAHAFRASGQL